MGSMTFKETVDHIRQWLSRSKVEQRLFKLPSEIAEQMNTAQRELAVVNQIPPHINLNVPPETTIRFDRDTMRHYQVLSWDENGEQSWVWPRLHAGGQREQPDITTTAEARAAIPPGGMYVYDRENGRWTYANGSPLSLPSPAASDAGNGPKNDAKKPQNERPEREAKFLRGFENLDMGEDE